MANHVGEYTVSVEKTFNAGPPPTVMVTKVILKPVGLGEDINIFPGDPWLNGLSGDGGKKATVDWDDPVPPSTPLRVNKVTIHA